MTDAEALAELRAQVELLLTDAEDGLRGVALTDRAEAIRISMDDVAAFKAQIRVLERCRRLIEAGDAPVERAAAA